MSGPSVEPPARPPSDTRRKLLVAMGFGAAAASLGRNLGQQGTSTVLSAVTEPTVPEATTMLTAPPALADAGPEPETTRTHALVIKNGRVIDPQSGFDGVLDVRRIGPLLRQQQEYL